MLPQSGYRQNCSVKGHLPCPINQKKSAARGPAPRVCPHCRSRHLGARHHPFPRRHVECGDRIARCQRLRKRKFRPLLGRHRRQPHHHPAPKRYPKHRNRQWQRDGDARLGLPARHDPHLLLFRHAEIDPQTLLRRGHDRVRLLVRSRSRLPSCHLEHRPLHRHLRRCEPPRPECRCPTHLPGSRPAARPRGWTGFGRGILDQQQRPRLRPFKTNFSDK